MRWDERCAPVTSYDGDERRRTETNGVERRRTRSNGDERRGPKRRESCRKDRQKERWRARSDGLEDFYFSFLISLYFLCVCVCLSPLLFRFHFVHPSHPTPPSPHVHPLRHSAPGAAPSSPSAARRRTQAAVSPRLIGQCLHRTPRPRRPHYLNVLAHDQWRRGYGGRRGAADCGGAGGAPGRGWRGRRWGLGC